MCSRNTHFREIRFRPNRVGLYDIIHHLNGKKKVQLYTNYLPEGDHVTS